MFHSTSSTSSARAAARTSSSLAPGRPTRRLSSTLPANRKFSCVTHASCLRSDGPVMPAYVAPVDQHGARRRQVKLGDQPGQRALAAARGADQRDLLPGLDATATAVPAPGGPARRRSRRRAARRGPRCASIGVASGSSCHSGFASSSANTRSAPAIAVSAWLYWLPRFGIAANRPLARNRNAISAASVTPPDQRLVAADHQHQRQEQLAVPLQQRLDGGAVAGRAHVVARVIADQRREAARRWPAGARSSGSRGCRSPIRPASR